MTGLFIDIDEYIELTEEGAVDIALKLMMPPPAEEFDYYESEMNQPITNGRSLKRNEAHIHRCLG